MNGRDKVRDPQTKVEGFVLATLVEVLAGRRGRRLRPTARARTPPKPGVRLGLHAAGVGMTASESFKALADWNMRVQDGRGLADCRPLEGSGCRADRRLEPSQRLTRGLSTQGAVYDLGIPATMTFYPIDAGGGWRFRHSRKLHSDLGGRRGVPKTRRDRDFANAEDNVD